MGGPLCLLASPLYGEPTITVIWAHMLYRILLAMAAAASTEVVLASVLGHISNGVAAFITTLAAKDILRVSHRDHKGGITSVEVGHSGDLLGCSGICNLTSEVAAAGGQQSHHRNQNSSSCFHITSSNVISSIPIPSSFIFCLIIGRSFSRNSRRCSAMMRSRAPSLT